MSKRSIDAISCDDSAACYVYALYLVSAYALRLRRVCKYIAIARGTLRELAHAERHIQKYIYLDHPTTGIRIPYCTDIAEINVKTSAFELSFNDAVYIGRSFVYWGGFCEISKQHAEFWYFRIFRTCAFRRFHVDTASSKYNLPVVRQMGLFGPMPRDFVLCATFSCHNVTSTDVGDWMCGGNAIVVEYMVTNGEPHSHLVSGTMRGGSPKINTAVNKFVTFLTKNHELLIKYLRPNLYPDSDDIYYRKEWAEYWNAVSGM